MTLENAHALLVGVGRYEDPLLTEAVTASDAEALAATLKSDSVGYPGAQVVTLTNEAASSESILAALDYLHVRTDNNSTVLVLLCGHGAQRSESGYDFLPHDAIVTSSGQYAPETVISNEKLAACFRNVKSKKMLVLFNTCFSGIMAAGSLGVERAVRPSTLAAPSEEALVMIRDVGEGRVTISACRSGQKSWFDPRNTNTIFMQSLIEGLKGARGLQNRRGYVGIFELYDYIFERVSLEATQIASGEKQEPVLTSREIVGPFPVALYKGGQTESSSALGSYLLDPQEVVPELNKRPTVQSSAWQIAAQDGGVINYGSIRNLHTGSGNQFLNEDNVSARHDIYQGSTINNQQIGGVRFGNYAHIEGTVAGGDVIYTGGSSRIDEHVKEQLTGLLKQLKADVDAERTLPLDDRYKLIRLIMEAEEALYKPQASQILSQRITTIEETLKGVVGAISTTRPLFRSLKSIADLLDIFLP
ncbi:MAG TPA: caspase family protein [Chloroflexia bacterium]|jgi:hypothetical protein